MRSASRVNESVFKAMKQVRRDVLKLIQTYVNRANDYAIFNQEMLPTLQGLVEDYQQNDPFARDPEVLNLFATLLKKQGNVISGFLQQILYNLCETTLVIIKDDFLTMPEFREGLFTLVQAIVQHGTQGLFQLPPEQFSTILMTILFAMKHEKPDLMELGLETMHSLNTLVVTNPEIASVFYERFYVLIVRDLLTLMTDYRHVSGFKLQGQILQQLIQVADSPAIA